VRRKLVDNGRASQQQATAHVRIGSKDEELTVSITSPLCGAKADITTRSADFAFGPIVLQKSPSGLCEIEI